VTLKLYQALAMRTKRKDMSAIDQLRNACYGMCGESGECIDVLKKHDFQGHTLDTDKLIDEAGDVLWYVAQLAEGLGVSLEEIAEHNIEKLKKRYPDGFDADKSIHREEYQ